MKFNPAEKFLLVLPKEITNIAKEVKTENGETVKILMGDRSRDLIVKAVNQGIIVESGSLLFPKGTKIVYYPFSPTKFMMEETEYHIIHERDVMGDVFDEME